MTGLYLFAAAAGIPLVLWFMISGGEDGGGADDGLAGVMFRRLPLSGMAIVAATFGVCGLVLTETGTSGGRAVTAAVIVGLVAGLLNGALFPTSAGRSRPPRWATSSSRARSGGSWSRSRVTGGAALP